MRDSTIASISSDFFDVVCNIARILSSTVMDRKIDASCGRYPIPSAARLYIGIFVISLPSTVMIPELGRSMPTII